ncbi:MAG: 3,4-dihydroxy-2-butanone-4-phosphate synthase [candidate division WOR-3 bacterium]|nr:3,4-dihydroxy-2-butanone-4-phosphate synthase [candidate division WOR-3 bacterium]MCX7948058.1 3,4-dihydroxy-2-butanone-4-phosphate synthase [candidate division WOR-3 bacterium]MDW8151004.1 3,4-dihydroxy-2-butanone-4-phosphate synthase [candidate division WOR-3 bacterium]
MLISIENAISRVKNGEILIIVDDEDRENEGDFFIPAEIVKPEHINFMAKVAGGLVCVSINYDRFNSLNLNISVSNTSKFSTPFGYPIDYKDVKTGSSAYERALTARMVCDETKNENDFIKPGHLYTLRARKGGVLERVGHTEASVDMARISGFYPAGVICEIMDENGEMARMPKLMEIANKYNLGIITITDLISYRLNREKIVFRINEKKEVETEYGVFNLYEYRDIYNKVHYVFEKETDNSIKYVRVHKINIFSDVLGIKNNIDYEKKKVAFDIISQRGGAFIYLDVVNGEVRSERVFKNYGIGAQIIRDLGYEKIVVITPNPMDYKCIEAFGIEIVDYIYKS